MNEQTTNTKLIAHLFFRLLPLQILLALVSAVNGIVSSLFASNYVGAEAMAAIGLFSPVIRLLGTVSTVFVAGSQIACGRYMGANQVERTQSVFFTDLVITTAISLLTSAVLVLGAATDLTRIITTQTNVHRVSDAIQPSHSLSSPSPPAPNPSQHQSLFQCVSSSHEVAKVLEFQLQHHSLQRNPRADLLQNGLVGSPCSPRDSQESSPTPQFKNINSSVLSFLHSPTLTSIHDH